MNFLVGYRASVYCAVCWERSVVLVELKYNMTLSSNPTIFLIFLKSKFLKKYQTKMFLVLYFLVVLFLI